MAFGHGLKTLDPITSLQTVKSAAKLLDLTNDLDRVAANPNMEEGNIEVFVRQLFALINSQNKSLHPFQYEAIAYLTGFVDESLPRDYRESLLRSFEKNNFLHDTKALAFSEFDKNVLILKWIARIIEPSRVDQRQELVCGVTAFMQMLIKDDPLAYAKYVTSLAQTGEATLNLGEGDHGGLRIVAQKNTFARKPRKLLMLPEVDVDKLDEADYLTLIPLRINQNILKSYDEESTSGFHKSIAGVTFAGEISAWMRATGYESVERIAMTSPDVINRVNLLIQDGYGYVFLTTGTLTQIIGNQGIDTGEKLSILESAVDGHYVQVRRIEYDAATNSVLLSINTWGEKYDNVRIPYDLFSETKGFKFPGEFTVGTTFARVEELRRTARRQSDLDRIHPYAYWRLLKSHLLAQDWYPNNKLPEIKLIGVKLPPNFSVTKYLPFVFENIMQLIADAPLHKRGGSWYEYATTLQDAIANLPMNKDYEDCSPAHKARITEIMREFLSYTIIVNAESNIHYNKLAKMINANAPKEEIKKLALQSINLNDAGITKLLLNYFLEQNDVATALEFYNKSKQSLNAHEQQKCNILIEFVAEENIKKGSLGKKGPQVSLHAQSASTSLLAASVFTAPNKSPPASTHTTSPKDKKLPPPGK